jgi:hypothetical protein
MDKRMRVAPFLQAFQQHFSFKRAAMTDPNPTQKARPFASEFFGNSKRLADRSFATNGAHFLQE